MCLSLSSNATVHSPCLHWNLKPFLKVANPSVFEPHTRSLTFYSIQSTTLQVFESCIYISQLLCYVLPQALVVSFFLGSPIVERTKKGYHFQQLAILQPWLNSNATRWELRLLQRDQKDMVLAASVLL